MPRFVEGEVRQRARDPTRSGRLTLLIGDDGSSAVVESLVEDVGGEVHETLPFSTLTASVPETAIERLLDCPAVETVALEGGMETVRGSRTPRSKRRRTTWAVASLTGSTWKRPTMPSTESRCKRGLGGPWARPHTAARGETLPF